MILDQHQIYLLILGGQIRGKWLLKYRGAQIWNNLPDDLKTFKTYKSFKKEAVLSMCKIKYK